MRPDHPDAHLLCRACGHRIRAKLHSSVRCPECSAASWSVVEVFHSDATRIPISVARQDIRRVVERARGGEVIVLTRHGSPQVVVAKAEDRERLLTTEPDDQDVRDAIDHLTDAVSINSWDGRVLVPQQMLRTLLRLVEQGGS